MRILTAFEQVAVWHTAMPYYHNTNAELNPGDEIIPAAERGHKSKWDQANGYDPHSVYMDFEEGPDAEVNWGDSNFGKNRYEVAPIGETNRDPEFEYNKKTHFDDVDWENGGVYNEEDVPGYQSYVAPRARVKRRVY